MLIKEESSFGKWFSQQYSDEETDIDTTLSIKTLLVNQAKNQVFKFLFKNFIRRES